MPDEAARDQALLERFKNEVRIARRVSHPNVCRVYDVGEVEGHTFFTMEYVDGEDLASLLRRIGRLPEDKALDIARQLCAGLAAAHAKGVLHRDLKPANIMLDGRGQVVITDFGLAGVADQIQGAEVRSGTPAYMAPEQLAGKEVSTRSDIYSLGLVLYEVFTGKRAFSEKPAEKMTDARRQNSEPAFVGGEGSQSGYRARHPSLPRDRAFGAAGDGSQRGGGPAGRRSSGCGAGGRGDAFAANGGGIRAKRLGCARELAVVCLACVLLGLAAGHLSRHSLQRAGEDAAGADAGSAHAKGARDHRAAGISGTACR